MAKKMTTEEFIRKAREVHGDKYDYSKVEYINSHTKVCIICPIHGEFLQSPEKHLIGRGCHKCGGSKKLTSEEFILKAREVHGDKYDYSKVEYKEANTKVCIICPEHGEFWQTPHSHLIGRGCLKCVKPNANMTTEEFIAKAKEIHGDKYDYSKVEYINSYTKVCIICPEHGEFWQTPLDHLSGRGCHKCGGTKKMDLEEFITKTKEAHGDKYDYSKVEYINSHTKVCIICPEHGEFWQDPSSHLQGCGCPKCNRSYYNMTTEEFIARAKQIHGNKYDYNNTKYVNPKTKVYIICPIHGEFQQAPFSHLSNCGCPKCGVTERQIKRSSTTEEFIAKARKVHGDKYDYSKVKYVNINTKVCIVCPEHGEFWQIPNNHLRGAGCPRCVRLNSNMTTDEFIEKAVEIHGDKYNYSKVIYVNANTKVCIICPEHGEFWQTPVNHLKGQGCPQCGVEKIWDIRGRKTTEDFIAQARKVHGDKYDYSKVEYVDSNTKVCIICPEHGDFFQAPSNHLSGQGCPNCSGLRKEYKFNLLEEFENEYAFRAFLTNNDINILQVILRNIEPKFEPIKRDIERALMNADDADPIQSLEDKYRNEKKEDNENEVETIENKSIFEGIDLDDDEAVNAMLNAKVEKVHNEDKDEKEPTIEDVVKNNEQELQVINRIEHMLTPEDREYIMKKFLNDKRRVWIAERESKLNK